MNRNLDIVKIENAVFDVLTENKVCENIFVGERPTTYDHMSEFIVVQVNSNVRDRTAYGDTFLGITFYLKDVANVRNSPRMSELYQQVLSLLPLKVGSFFFDYFNVTPTVKDGAGFFKQILNLKTFITE